MGPDKLTKRDHLKGPIDIADRSEADMDAALAALIPPPGWEDVEPDELLDTLADDPPAPSGTGSVAKSSWE